MTRLRLNDVSSFGTSNPITFADGTTTTGSWSSAPPLPTIASPDYAVIVVDPDTANAEIVYLTAYTSGATSGTFIRAAETATGGRARSSGAAHSAKPWAHGPVATDYVGTATPEIGSGGQTVINILAPNGLSSSVGNMVYIADAAAYAGTGNGILYSGSNTDGAQIVQIFLGSTGQFEWLFDAAGTTTFPDAIDTGKSKTSGALSTLSLTSGTAAQVDTTHDRTLVVPTSTAGSVQVDLSPDNTTFTTLYTKTTAASDEVTVRVPARWYVKITATTSTLGTGHTY